MSKVTNLYLLQKYKNMPNKKAFGRNPKAFINKIRNFIVARKLPKVKQRHTKIRERTMGNVKEKEEKHATHGLSQFRLTNKLLNNLSQFKVSPIAKLVLLELSACYNPNKPDMFPKQKTLAAKIGVSERSIVRAIQELFKAGLILIECKYTNRYVFTSQIVSEGPQQLKNFEQEKMSDDLRQNDLKQTDILSEHDIQPINEQIKEPIKVDDYKILKEYAVARVKDKTKVNAYINTIVRNGGAESIIAKQKEKEAADRFAAKRIAETQKITSEPRGTGIKPTECQAIRDCLRKNFGIIVQ